VCQCHVQLQEEIDSERGPLNYSKCALNLKLELVGGSLLWSNFLNQHGPCFSTVLTAQRRGHQIHWQVLCVVECTVHSTSSSSSSTVHCCLHCMI
jgi:hypothetical protein